MSNSKVINNYNSSAAVGILTAVLVVLKVLGYITWSWWLVFLPMYIGLAILLAIFAIAGLSGLMIGIIYITIKAIETKKNKMRNARIKKNLGIK